MRRSSNDLEAFFGHVNVRFVVGVSCPPITKELALQAIRVGKHADVGGSLRVSECRSFLSVYAHAENGAPVAAAEAAVTAAAAVEELAKEDEEAEKEENRDVFEFERKEGGSIASLAAAVDVEINTSRPASGGIVFVLLLESSSSSCSSFASNSSTSALLTSTQPRPSRMVTGIFANANHALCDASYMMKLFKTMLAFIYQQRHHDHLFTSPML